MLSKIAGMGSGRPRGQVTPSLERSSEPPLVLTREKILVRPTRNSDVIVKGLLVTS